MSVTRLGVLSVGAVVPSVPLSIAQITALLAIANAQKASLSANLALFPIALPSAAPLIAALNNAITNVTAELAALAAPSTTAGITGSLSASIGALTPVIAAAASLSATLAGAVSVGGVSAYAYAGPGASLGVDVGAAVVADLGGSTALNALVLATSDPAAWAALGALLKTS